MKKLLTSFLLLAFASHLFSQEENNLKNFRFGLLAIPSVNWYKPDDVKKFEKNGSKLGFGWGMQMEFRLNSLISLTTGLQVNYDRGNLKFTDTTNYFYDTKNQVIVEPKDTGSIASLACYKLNSRYYKTTYVVLPLYLKMKTKQIGAMTYFGQFGINTSIKLKSKVTDNVTEYNNYRTPAAGMRAPSDLTDLDMSDDMNILKFGLHIGGGAEYNISGSTSLFFGLSYNLGFSNVLKKNSKYLEHWAYSANPLNNVEGQKTQIAVGNNFAFTIGILF